MLQIGWTQLRIADHELESRGIGPREADLILALDPHDALRHREQLSPAGTIVAGSLGHDIDALWSILHIGHLVDPRAHLSHAEAFMLGAASDFLPVDTAAVRAEVHVAGHPAYDAGMRALKHREVVDEFDTFALVAH